MAFPPECSAIQAQTHNSLLKTKISRKHPRKCRRQCSLVQHRTPLNMVVLRLGTSRPRSRPVDCSPRMDVFQRLGVMQQPILTVSNRACKSASKAQTCMTPLPFILLQPRRLFIAKLGSRANLALVLRKVVGPAKPAFHHGQCRVQFRPQLGGAYLYPLIPTVPTLRRSPKLAEMLLPQLCWQCNHLSKNWLSQLSGQSSRRGNLPMSSSSTSSISPCSRLQLQSYAMKARPAMRASMLAFLIFWLDFLFMVQPLLRSLLTTNFHTTVSHSPSTVTHSNRHLARAAAWKKLTRISHQMASMANLRDLETTLRTRTPGVRLQLIGHHPDAVSVRQRRTPRPPVPARRPCHQCPDQMGVIRRCPAQVRLSALKHGRRPSATVVRLLGLRHHRILLLRQQRAGGAAVPPRPMAQPNIPMWYKTMRTLCLRWTKLVALYKALYRSKRAMPWTLTPLHQQIRQLPHHRAAHHNQRLRKNPACTLWNRRSGGSNNRNSRRSTIDRPQAQHAELSASLLEKRASM